MSRAENEEFWDQSDTSKNIGSFWDEDADQDTRWSTGATFSTPKSAVTVGSSKSETANISDTSLGSITDNISQPDALPGATIAKGMGKAIGEKLDLWKPPSVSIKWKPEQGSGSCLQCISKEEEIAQLKKRLETAYSRYNITLAPEDTVNKMMLAQPYSIESYRSKEDKLALIDAALATIDGSSILTTVLHLKNTTKKSIFNQEMRQRPAACRLYVSYLKERYEFSEAIDFLSMLGQIEEAAILRYQDSIRGKNSENKVKRLKNCIQTHFKDPALTLESRIVNGHLNLLERQMAIEANDSKDTSNRMMVEFPRVRSIIDQSLLTTLFYCCMYHWDTQETHQGSPLSIKKIHSISEHQFLWSVLRGRAKVKHWVLPHELDTLLSNRTLMGTIGAFTGMGNSGGRAVKSSLNVDQVVEMLASLGAPDSVLAAYIALADSVDMRLKMATNYKCHQAAVDVYVSQKDREALEKYMREIPQGSAEYVKAEAALKGGRWKN
ncbi:unnamed protein product [Meganyctiphanes norvegica]|uniref:Vps16 C-terminal domain-containing protein n=1 Tax=Meganyctiphanes norvegica TaxID=48144 RepID=A0AAV2QNI8_MEGNR